MAIGAGSAERNGPGAAAQVIALIEAAEAKATYGLQENRELLTALARRLSEDHTLTGAEVAAMCEEHGAQPFWDVDLKGFEWDKEGNLVYPPRPEASAASNGKAVAP